MLKYYLEITRICVGGGCSMSEGIGVYAIVSLADSLSINRVEQLHLHPSSTFYLRHFVNGTLESQD